MGGKVGGLGAMMLAKLGWKEGTGLGAKEDGRTDIVKPSRSRKRENQGLGRRKAHDDHWWEKLMNDAYGPSALSSETKKDVDLFEACESRRCRPHGTAKLARLEAHDRQQTIQSEPFNHSDSDSNSGSDSDSDICSGRDTGGVNSNDVLCESAERRSVDEEIESEEALKPSFVNKTTLQDYTVKGNIKLNKKKARKEEHSKSIKLDKSIKKRAQRKQRRNKKAK